MTAGIRPGRDLVHRLLDDFLELEDLSPDLILADVEDLPLGRFEQLVRRELIGITVTDDFRGVLDQLAVDRLLFDELGVVLGVRRVRNTVDDLLQRVVPADVLELAALVQLGGKGHHDRSLCSDRTCRESQL